ncbi:hypothetical protein M885DRAFT_127843 [Pelagophyceae sp. CCMP2097]|nr:hypothetical protein M885DRAFT_127843 [Pelagophyceae sp. CCMP2097]
MWMPCMALTLSMLVRPRAAVVALRLVRRRGGARLVLASSSSSSTPSSTSSTRATPANGAEVPRRAVALSVPEDFVVPEWWDSATPSETARALELLPRLVSFVGELDKDRLARVQTLEAQLEGMDAGAKSVAAHLRLDVAQLWELRVKSLDDSLKVLQADKRETAEAYRARVSTLEATLASARDEPKALLAAMEAAQQEGRLGRGALETALASLRAENVYSKDQLEKERELHRAALEQARSATFLHAPKLGAIGEGDMEDVIVDALRCDISDVSKTAGMGDRFVTTPDGMKMFQVILTK